MGRRVVLIAVLVALAGLPAWYLARSARQPAPLHKIVVNVAARTLLSLPLYVALDQHYFEQEKLDARIVTGGTAASSFAAMMSGEAQFSQADPMYAPIRRAKGADAVVVANVVGRIGIWGIAHTEPPSPPATTTRDVFRYVIGPASVWVFSAGRLNVGFALLGVRPRIAQLRRNRLNKLGT